MSLCECGCGGEASPGCRFIVGHYARVNNPLKNPATVKKKLETQRINKEIKEGKRPAPELPFCACGCGGRVAKLGNKYIKGHHMRGKKIWNKGLTKETDERVKKQGETYKERYANGEIDEIWSKGKTKEDDPRLMQLSESLLDFYQSDEGIELKIRFSKNEKGEGNPFYGKQHTDEAKERMKEKHSTEEVKEKHRQDRKNQKFPNHHTDIELRCEEFSVKNSIPVVYTGDSSFWIPVKNNGKKCVNPDFILYANRKKFVIELLGDYWHSPFLNKNVRDDDIKNRKKHYRRYRWIPIFIWGSDIMRPEGEKFFLSELKKAGAI